MKNNLEFNKNISNRNDFFNDLSNIMDKNISFSYFDCIESTNDYLKNNYCKLPLNHVVIANEQTKGRGKNNKSFLSPANSGVYFSFFFKSLYSFEEISKITIIAAVAIAKAIEKLASLKVQLKWINDILIDNSKVGGILCENILSDDNKNIEYTIVGIGINVKKINFPRELQGIASSLENFSAVDINRALLIETIRNNFFNMLQNKDFDYLTYYRSRSATIGKNIIVFENNISYNAHAVDINNNGELIIQVNGIEKILTSADISIRN